MSVVECSKKFWTIVETSLAAVIQVDALESEGSLIGHERHCGDG